MPEMRRNAQPFIAVALMLAACTRGTPSAPTSFLEIESCKEKSGVELERCYAEFVERLAKAGKTTKDMLVMLEEARTKDEWIENDCHPMVHAIGRWTYKQKGSIGDAFQVCDQTCHSGCFHGAMERLFFSEEDLAKGENHPSFEDLARVVPTMCAEENFRDPSPQVVFQCLHGGGHAILHSLVYDLDLALKTCDLMPNSRDSASCYGGVFMENITAFKKEERDLKAGEPLYPCSKLDEKYLSDCYTMQTSVMFEQGLSDEEIAKTCAALPRHADRCFVSLGRDLSNDVRTGKAERVRRACEDLSGDHARDCISGTLYAVIDNTWDGSFAYEYCRTLQDEDLKRECYRAATDYLRWAYGYDRTKLLGSCNEHGKSERQLCKDAVWQLAFQAP